MSDTNLALVEQLIDRAAGGDDLALQDLLERFRPRLRQMVKLRIDERLAARVDESDVVQEALLLASQRIPEYARTRAVPFYPWLRAIAWNRLVDIHRRHIHSQRRSVTRERRTSFELSSESIARLADYLVASGTHPSGGMMRQEMNARVSSALLKLGNNDREVLTLRYLEQLSSSEVTAILGISSDAVLKRTVRALRRLRVLLEDDIDESTARR